MRLREAIDSGGVYTIAELSANHGGSLEHALDLTRAAIAAGADCVKTQTYTADSLTLDCDSEWFRIKSGLWAGRTFHDVYEEGAMPWEWNIEIRNECARLGADFLSTPFDLAGADYLESIDSEAYKIASFELVDIPLIEHVAAKGKTVIMSCGMASPEEIADAIDACRRMGNDDLVILKCCSEYPAPYDDMNLSVIPDMRKRFGVPVGLSDHTLGATADIAAVALGACVIEKHFCLSREDGTLDTPFSATPEEFADMVEKVGIAARMRGSASYELSEREQIAVSKRRSIFASRDIAVGEPFTEDNVRSVRPGAGLPPKLLKGLLGKKSKRDIPFGSPILQEDL